MFEGFDFFSMEPLTILHMEQLAEVDPASPPVKEN